MAQNSFIAEHRLLAFREVPGNPAIGHSGENPENPAKGEHQEIQEKTGNKLQNLRQSIEEDSRKIQDLDLKKNDLHFECDRIPMLAVRTKTNEILALRMRGAIVRFRHPIPLKDFDESTARKSLDILQRIAERFGEKALVDLTIDARDARYEYVLGDEKKLYVATTSDILEVIEKPTIEQFKEWESARDALAILVRNSFEMDNRFRSLHLHQLSITELDATQKEFYESYQQFQKTLKTAHVNEEALWVACNTRLLKAGDSSLVRENPVGRAPESYEWLSLGSDGKPRQRFHWYFSKIPSITDYENGEKIRETHYKTPELPTHAYDLRHHAKDVYDADGRLSYREVLGSDSNVQETYLYGVDGTLLDRAALEAMSPVQLEKMLLSRWENSMNRESDELLANACFSVADLICRCPKGEALLRKAIAGSPEQAFMAFAKYKTAPYAIDLLEAAGFRLGKSDLALGLMEDMDVLKQLPRESKIRILDAMYGKMEESELARIFLKTDRADSNKERFLKDPALRHWSKVEESWIDWERLASLKPSRDEEKVWRLQVRAMIARNLSFQRKDVNEQTVRDEALRIARMRDVYAKVPLFKHRNVLHIAHNEKIRDVQDENGQPIPDADIQIERSGDPNRFGKSAVRQEIRRQIGRVGDYSFIRPTKSAESLSDSKAAILRAFVTMEPPATFLFDGHGGPDAFYLSDGSITGTARTSDIAETKSTMKITVQELAAALRERAEKFHQTNLTSVGYRDFFIFDSCYNSDFIRGLYERMGDAPKPIVLGVSEYGQYSYSELGSRYGGAFMEKVLKFERKSADPITFGDVFHNEFEGESNPSLYIPNQEGLPMQVTQDDRDEADSMKS